MNYGSVDKLGDEWSISAPHGENNENENTFITFSSFPVRVMGKNNYIFKKKKEALLNVEF